MKIYTADIANNSGGFKLQNGGFFTYGNVISLSRKACSMAGEMGDECVILIRDQSAFGAACN